MSAEAYNGYSFRYVHDDESPGKVKVYIELQPPYGERDVSPKVIHRWPAKDGAPPYICFKEAYKPETFSEARRMAHAWADRTDLYIRTGSPPSAQVSEE